MSYQDDYLRDLLDGKGMLSMHAVLKDKEERQAVKADPKPVQKKFWWGKPPVHCQLCGSKLTTAFIDGRTQFGPWAIMCPICHRTSGCGFGTGCGQKYILPSMRKTQG
jgi:hypothetical protein